MPDIPTIISREVLEKYSIDRNTFFFAPKNDSKDLIQTEVGDSKQDDFVPQIKIMRWDNEVNCSIRLFHDEITPIIITEAEKIIWQGDKVEAHFYDIRNKEHPEGASEFEVILKEKPDTNKVEFTLNTKGLDFFYQPELTQDEIDEGAERPENVVGSYAVYASEEKVNYAGGKEYKCGKIGHIFRPKIIDSAGAEVLGELKIDNDILSVTIPQDFLDKAVYPVRHAAGLTFGYTTAGASLLAMGGRISGSLFTGAAGTGVSISARMSSTSAYNQYFKFGLYVHSDLSLLSNGTTNEQEGHNYSIQWKSANFISAPTLTAVDYVIVLYHDSGLGSFAYDSGDTNQGHRLVIDYGAWPNPLSSPTHGTQKFSIYCTYTAGGGGISIPVAMHHYMNH